eukprot:TRINITY_DN3102_c0_g1_i3.p1 TRINITY_DN3102_c0_g1~~TRINITY_DN3102_c0_g1_i3.p1  ORF type:complete len:176 (-),score=33.68 TRINITY_DN3102_c0_g1_i3:163-690(-)
MAYFGGFRAPSPQFGGFPGAPAPYGGAHIHSHTGHVNPAPHHHHSTGVASIHRGGVAHGHGNVVSRPAAPQSRVSANPLAEHSQATSQPDIANGPKVDFHEEHFAWVLAADFVPGTQASNIWVVYNDQSKRIAIHGRDGSGKEFRRSFQLGNDINAPGLDVSFQGQSLTVTVPKK